MGDEVLNAAPASAAAAPTHGLARRTGVGMMWGQAGKSLEALLTLAIAVAAVRALNPNAFGLYSLLTYLAGSASVLIPLVMVEGGGAVLRRFADGRERLSLVSALMVVRLALIGLVIAVLLPGWDVFRELFGLDAISYRVFAVGAVYWLAQDTLNSLAGFYSVELNLRRVAFWKPFGQLVTLALIVYVAATEDRWASGVGEVLAAVVVGYGIAIVGLAWGLRTYGAPRVPSSEAVSSLLAITRDTWLIGVLGFALATQFDVLLIGALTSDPREVAFYVLAVGVVGRAHTLLVSGWSALMIPAASDALVHGGAGGLERAWRLFARLWLVAATAINAVLLGVAIPLVEALFGHEYGRAGTLLVLVCAFALVTSVFASPPSIAVLWALDRQPLILRVRIAAAVLNIALAVPLIERYAALGAVVATGVAGLATAVAEFALARKHARVRLELGFSTVVLAAGAIATVIGLVLTAAGTPGLVAALLASPAVFVGALALMRPLDAEDLEVLTRISPRLARVARSLARDRA